MFVVVTHLMRTRLDAIDHLVSLCGSSVIQDHSGVSTRWCKWDSNYQLTCEGPWVLMHVPHALQRNWSIYCGQANKYLKRVHINIAGPMPVASTGGKSYMYVVVDDYTRTIYAKAPHFKSEVVEVFKTFRVAAETESGMRSARL